MADLKNKRVVVTGGSKGIGRGICIEMAASGADVVLSYNRSSTDAMEIVAEIEKMGGRAYALKADFSNSAETNMFIDKAAELLGGIDVLVHCAGVFPQALIGDITDDEWYKVMRINMDSAFFACRAVVKHLRRNDGKGGRIILLSSQAALAGTAHGCHYGASKAGILGLTYCLAKELGPDLITVNAVLPGRIETDMLKYASEERRRDWIKGTPVGYLGEPSDIAGVTCFLASDSARYITGAKINVNGGLLPG